MTNPMSIPISFLFLFLFMNNCASLGADSISSNQSLSGDETIVSANGIFVLGFCTPGNSSNYYLGMWYKMDPSRAIVWVANRERSVADRFSSEVRISDGNLVLFGESKLPVWSTNVSSGSSPSIEAVLLDNGNLVLRDGSNASQSLWESFDHPTDTWLQGSKIGYDKKTRKKTLLTSWKSPEDPAPGLFTYELLTSDSSFAIVRNRSKVVWTSGPWDEKLGAFRLTPQMKYNRFFNFTYVSNDNESYLIFNISFSAYEISRFVMDISGQMREYILMPNKEWRFYSSQPTKPCQVFASCGAYGSCDENSVKYCSCLRGFEPKVPRYWDMEDYSTGCVRKTKLQCANNNHTNQKRDRFLEMRSMSSPGNKQFVKVANIAACVSTCLNNCSCTAYSFNGNGCSIWTGDLLDLQQLTPGNKDGRTLYIRLDASEFKSPKHKKRLIIGVAVCSTIVSVILLVLIHLFTSRRKKIVKAKKMMEGSLVAFSYKDLQNATKNFSEKLGGGGFGSVFKGMLPNSTMIAVKKLESVGQGEKQFRAEVSTIGTIQHVNLIRLRGFCSEGIKKLLVYDYMSNGSLASHLFNQNNSNVLDWKTRYQIALGTARGLVYLHEKCRDCIIHCDIKPENVLLDAVFCPKVADFGLSKLIGRDFSRVLTTMRGTRGYLAPEWITGVAITPKTDVYSFGMMLFELVSGRRNSEQTEINGKLRYFPNMAISVVVEGGDVLSLLDERLEGNADKEEIERVCKVACWCIQDDEAHRPSMSQVVQMLEGIMDVSLPPIPRFLHIFDDHEDNVIFFRE
ncbi:G-type lectin S-receptor-like serine/threonine-protein kinase At2g19130 [Morus notabilis]|uniref:G-type lectin S-receptor-like serine/threonine-protein kinase At2g19130 n=1 Tax=Morus notabilis TaxID=981085 RepID=UPI000CED484A|nr:G-type lectin S-receptor-like serine/threonine-protein kinase At2g19130 [Morus notabilis]